MAKDVITRFKLETTQYDSALRTASNELSDYAKTASNAGKDFDKFTKSNAEAARAFGNIATSATNSKEKVKELVGAYNEMARAYELLSKEQQQSDWGKAMAESLTKLQQRIKDAKEELYGLGNAVEDVKSKSSGLFGEGGLTGMMAVAGGNLLAKGVTMLAGELTDAIGKSIELAKQGEGIRIAFDRLNRTDLLDQLKEATHGTVSELELMKQAVKFNDFNLNLDEIGTLLAFAQQKAKDTGQSVDYMVDSIVTGLGRQSLMILDNLGLSAAEIKERMKEGSDMTTAVASIIKDQMSEAGEYIETAADRAARAAADAANEMEAFGRTAAPIAEEWSQTWKTLTIGAMNFANTLLGPVARSIRSIQNILNTNPEDRITGSKYNLFNGYTNQGPATKPTWGDIPVKTAPGGYVEVTDRNTGAVIGGQHFDNLQDTNSIKTWQKTLGKSGSKSGSKSGKGGTSPQEQAEKKVAEALHAYQQTIEQSAIELKAGTITEAGAKKKELQAQERLWDAYGDAYNIYKADKYKEAQNKTAQEIVRLGGEVKSLTDEEEKAKQAARELASTQKKVAAAMTEAQTAYQNNDLKGYLSAMKKAGADPSQGMAAGGFTFTNANLDAFKAQLKEQLSQADLGSELYNNLTAQLTDATTLGNVIEYAIQNGIDVASIDPQKFWLKIFGENPGDYIDDSIWEKVAEAMGEGVGKNLKISKKGEVKESQKDGILGDTKKMLNGLSSITSGLQQIGIDIPQEIQAVISVIQGLMSIIEGVNVVIGITQTTALTANTAAMIELSAALWANTATSLLPFANGGIVPHAANGYYVPGNNYSGDRTPILANAGELILNKAQQGNLASQLAEGGMMGNLRLEAVVTGENLRFVLNNNGKRTGRGEYVQTNRR